MNRVTGKRYIFLSASVLALISIWAPVSSAAPPIVVDHTSVAKYEDIPQYWIDEVKKMRLNVPGESHSLAYRRGLTLLAGIDPTYAANATETGPPEAYTIAHLRVDRLKGSSPNNWGDTGTGEADWYTNATGIAAMKTNISWANTNSLGMAAIGFGWCWDMTWHNGLGGTEDPVYRTRWAGASEGGPEGDLRWGLDAASQALTGNSINLDTYLAATQQYVDYVAAQGYPTKVFFTTGPIESANTGELGYQKHLKQQRIRDYVNSHGGTILFDYADILSYNDAGTQTTTTWTDYGSTLRTFARINDNNMLDMSGSYAEDGDHIGERGALRIGKALWYMLARIAGWDGVPGGGDNIPPAVTSVIPSGGATGVAVNTSVAAAFSEAIDPLTVTTATFTLKNGAATVSGAVSASGGNATFTPGAPLAFSTTFTAALTTGIKDLAGNSVASLYSWTFTTGTAPDATPPTVASTTPASNASNVPVNITVTATFSEPVDPSTVSTASLTLKDGSGAPVAGTVNLAGTVATFTPSTTLAGGATYAAAITPAVKDLAGNTIAAPYSWSFVTENYSPGASSSSGGGCSVAPGRGDPGDFSGVFGALGYATLLFFLRARRKGKRV